MKKSVYLSLLLLTGAAFQAQAVPAIPTPFSIGQPDGTTVTVTLSGMSNFEQLKENIDTFQEEKPLNEEELKALLGIAGKMLEKKVLPCTACRYCTAHCPKGLDIPSLLSLYNEHLFTEGGFIAPMAMKALPEEKRPEACIGCRSCEAVCPQQIKISEAMKDFTERTK